MKSLGPSRGSYSTPLNTSRTMAETCVADVCIADVHGVEHPLRLKGIMNAGNNMSVLSVKTGSFREGSGTFELGGLPDVIFPAHARKGFPYAKVRFNGTTKSVDSFLSQLGFTALPRPTIEQIARAVHIKFACAGTDTLYYQSAILGFHIPREICRAVSTSCHLCPHKTLHGPLETIRSEDIIAPDVTEATLNEAERAMLGNKVAVAAGIPSTAEGNAVTSSLPTQTLVQGVPVPTKRAVPAEDESEQSPEANELDYLLFGAKFSHEDDGNKRIGALEATENQEVLVFDYCHWGNNNV